MMKPIALLVALSTTVMLAGCELYFGKSNDRWDYCGSDGYHQCDGDNCEWVSPSCPSDTPAGAPNGYQCQANTDCAAGCYCASGVCEEAGFCTQDGDCGEGYVCNHDRSSCEPGGGPTACAWDNECPSGQYCSPDSLTCTATCTCTNDQQALDQGFGWCDETRNTCLPGQDPAGTCGGEATCTTAQPTCPAGQVPTLIDGCWTGSCRDFAACDVNPGCTHINDEGNCLGRADCSGVYNGLNCTKPDGSACHAGDANCSCQSFVFASCRSRTAMRSIIVRDQYGHMLDASQLILN